MVVTSIAKRPYLERILASDIEDEQAIMATSLLALADDDGRLSMSTWVATEMYACSNEVWLASVQALVDAGLVRARWRGEVRCDLEWIRDERRAMAETVGNNGDGARATASE